MYVCDRVFHVFICLYGMRCVLLNEEENSCYDCSCFVECFVAAVSDWEK